MAFLTAAEMGLGKPLHGWTGRFFHSQNMTFALWEIAADAVPLHEHYHPQEEVWNIVEGRIAITVDGVERELGPGDAVIVPPGTRHSARALGACRVVVADWPVREQLPGLVVPPRR